MSAHPYIDINVKEGSLAIVNFSSRRAAGIGFISLNRENARTTLGEARLVAGHREESLQDISAELPVGEFDARFRKPLMAFFLRRVQSHNEAEDMTQEVFVRLLRHEGSVCTASAQAYVFQIATNLLRDRRRRAQTHAEAMHSSIDAPADAHPIASALIEDRGPERVFTGREDLRAAIAVLDELGERTRDIFLLFRVEKMKQREIAALYGISVSAVEKHVVKAAVHLAQRFGQS